MKKLTKIMGALVLMSALAFVGCAQSTGGDSNGSNNNSNNNVESHTVKMTVSAVANTETEVKELTKFYDGGSSKVYGNCVINNDNATIKVNDGQETLKVSVADVPADYKLILKENGFSDNVNMDNLKMYILNPDTLAKDVTIELTFGNGISSKITGAKYVLLPSLMGADKGYDLFKDRLMFFGYFQANVEIPQRFSQYKTDFEKFKTAGTVTNIYDLEDHEDNTPCLLFEYSSLKETFYNKVKSQDRITSQKLSKPHDIRNVNPDCKYIEVQIVKNNDGENIYRIVYAENVSSWDELTKNSYGLPNCISKMQLDELLK